MQLYAVKRSIMPSEKTTHFGYQTVAEEDKQSMVAEVFDSVASSYDIMNDAMSLGIHRLWKRYAMAKLSLKSGDAVLDLAAGTGDLTRHALSAVGDTGHVTMTDINPSMLAEGRDRLLDQGFCQRLTFLEANAEALPFADQSFDAVMMGFGLRNVTHKEKALKEMQRVLVPGGRAMVLEFSKPQNTLVDKAYDWISFNILPQLGEWIANDRDSYQYLVESIRMHPDQEALCEMFYDAGFDKCSYHNLTNGVAAVHIGVKY